MKTNWMFRICSLAAGIALFGATASLSRAQTEGIPVALVGDAIHNYRMSLTPASQKDREWRPRKAWIGSRVNSFTILSAGVYTANFMDMVKTESSLPNF